MSRRAPDPLADLVAARRQIDLTLLERASRLDAGDLRPDSTPLSPDRDRAAVKRRHSQRA